MKSLFLTLFLTLSALTAFGQAKEQAAYTIANMVAEETEGYIDGENHDVDYYMYFVKPQSHYDFDLLRLIIRNAVNSYTNVTFVNQWARQKENYFSCSIKYESTIVHLAWFEDLHLLAVWVDK